MAGNLSILYLPFPDLERKARAGEHLREVMHRWPDRSALHVLHTKTEAKTIFSRGFSGVLYVFAHSVATEGLALESGDYLSATEATQWMPPHGHKWPGQVILNTCHAKESGWADVFRSQGATVQCPEHTILMSNMRAWGNAVLKEVSPVNG